MAERLLEIENVSKQYRLGMIGGGLLYRDINSWIARKLGREDPNRKIGTNTSHDGETFLALDGINFNVDRGDALALVGRNGAGKSTMLKLISRITAPSTGEIRIHGRVASLLEVGTGFPPELTGRENIYLNGALLGYRKEFIDEHFQDIVDFAELQNFMDMPLKNYSSGMVARIAFAIATITEPDILIVDETLSVGDFLFQQKCERRIKELVDADDVTVLLVSHNIDQVERLCDRVCWIEKGQERMVGPTDEVCAAYKSLGN